MKTKHRLLALLLAIFQLVSIVVNPVFAAEVTDSDIDTHAEDALDAEVGTEENPADANGMWFAGAECYLLNPTLEANSEYWYSFVAESAGIVVIQNFTYGNAYQMTVIDGNTVQEAVNADGAASNPLATFPVVVGEEVLICVSAEEAGKVYVNLVMVDGSSDDPVEIKDVTYFLANVPAGQTICYQGHGNMSLKGMVVSGDDVADATVVADGVEYTDLDGDGTIELTLPGNLNAATPVPPAFSITNDSDTDMTYEVYIVESAAELPHVHDLEHSEKVEATCHQTGMNEYWYCAVCDCYFADEDATEQTNRLSLVIPAAYDLAHVPETEACHVNGTYEYWFCPHCDAVYADAAGTQQTNRMNLTKPADNELTYVAAVEAGCHQNGSAEYWYCAECEAVFADAAGEQLTNRLNLTVPAAVGLTHVEAVEAGCHQNGCAEYWYCTECEAVFSDAAGKYLTNVKSLTVMATVGLTHVEAVEANCHQNGSAEYWYCAGCEAVFADAAGEQLTNRLNLTVPATVGLTHVEAVEAGCHQNGCAEYWYCTECEAVFSDAAGKYLTNVKSLTVMATVGLTHVAAVEANCHQNGSAEYWYCAGCEAVFADAAATILTNRKNLTIAAENELVYVPGVAANCHQNGSAEYWYCPECDAVFADAAGEQLTNRKNLTIAAQFELVHVEAVEATCHQNGSAEYWYCPDCQAVFTDAAGKYLTNVKNLTITSKNNLTHVEAVEATCHQNGCAEYWYCAECEAVFADAAGIYLTNVKNLTVLAANELVHVEAVEAGCHQNGSAEYWYCPECDAVFADAAATQLTNRKNLTVLARNELTYVEGVEVGCHQNGMSEYWFCAECDAVFADAAATQLTNRKNLVIAAQPLTHAEAVEACHIPGCAEYWYCETCSAVFADAAAAQLTNRMNLTIPADNELTYVAAVEPGCHQTGNTEYWYCDECEGVYADAEGRMVTNRKNVTIPALNDLIHVEAVAANCHQEGSAEYWYCPECDAVFADAAATQLTNRKNLVVPANNELVYVAAVPAACHQNGSAEYWYCPECAAVFADAAATIVTNRKNLTILAANELVHEAAVAATCHQTGMAEYWYCPDCDAVFTDAAGKYLSNRKNLVIPAESELVNVPAVEPTCHQAGNNEYWYCAECEAVFADAAGVHLTNRKNVTLPALNELSYSPAVAPTCHQDGMGEYWYCAECDAVFADAAGTQLTNRKNLTIEAEALTHVEAVEPCHQAGMAEHWWCETCDAVFTDAAGKYLTNRMNLTVPADNELTYVAAVEPGCHQTGNTEYWYCGECEAVYADAEGRVITNRKNVTVPALNELIHVAAVEANCHQNGSAEYWYCEACDAVFADAAATILTNRKNLTIVAETELTHVAAVEAGCHQNGSAEYWYCEICDAVFADAAATILTNRKNLVTLAKHELAYVPAAEACHANGTQEYWFCPECDAVFADAAGTILTNRMNLTIPAVTELTYMEAHDACHMDGNMEYWYCGICDGVYSDAEGRYLTNRKNVTIPADAELEHVEATDPQCHSLGNVEYWFCVECQGFYLDAEGTRVTNAKSVVLPVLGNENLQHFEAVAPSCHDLGNVEYWYCGICDGYWLDEAATQLTNSKRVILPELGSENVEHVEALAPTCHDNGNVEYWFCADCERYFQDEACTQITNSKRVVLPAEGSENLRHVEAVDPTCHGLGNIEHWYCPDCDRYFQDEACTLLTNSKNVILPALGNENLQHFEAVEPTCHYNGNIEYWYCDICQTYFQDEACTQITNAKRVILPAVGTENVIHFEHVSPTCHSNGNVEYWYCADCSGYWSDEACTRLTNAKRVVLPALGSPNLQHFEAVDPTCHSNGNVEYWYCPDCYGYWTDEACTQLTNSKRVTLPALGSDDMEHYEFLAPTCHSNGNDEYWYCDECEGYFLDEAGIRLTNAKRVILPALGSDEMQHFEAVAPTCHSNGNIEYWYCGICQGYWQDEACTQLTNAKRVILPADGSENMIHYEAVDPTCHGLGNIEYWYCADCEGYFQDENCTQITNAKRVILPALGNEDMQHFEAVDPTCHGNGNIEYWYCDICESCFQDEACTQITNAKRVILPALGSEDMQHFEAVAPTCHYNGNIEYWYCADCDRYFQDEACTQLTNAKRVILPALGSENVEHFEAVEPTCHGLGNVEYWYCADCEGHWLDENCTQLTNSKRVILPALGSENMEHHEAVAPTCKTEGNVEYWYCADCGGYYLDEEGLQLTNAKRVILPAAECASAAFSDLDLDAWYHDATDFVLNNGIMNGNEDGTFAPEGTLTRAELVQILFNVEGRPEVETTASFSDVEEGDWYYDAIMWAAENGIVLGHDDGTYAPNDAVTREQMVAILWRYAGSQEPAATELTFADAAEVSDWAETAVLWAVENGIVKGVGNNEFAPKANSERAAAAQVMMNYFNK